MEVLEKNVVCFLIFEIKFTPKETIVSLTSSNIELIMFPHVIDVLQVSPERIRFMKAVLPFLRLNRKKSNVLSAFKHTFPLLTIFWKISLHSLTNYVPLFMWRKREGKFLQTLNTTHQIKKYQICFEFPCYTS